MVLDLGLAARAPSRSGTARQTPRGQPEWVDEPGSDATGIDQSRVSRARESTVAARSHPFRAV